MHSQRTIAPRLIYSEYLGMAVQFISSPPSGIRGVYLAKSKSS